MPTLKKCSVEICVDSLASALAAQHGGADRIELCAGLDEDGLTPAEEILQSARERLTIGIHVMIRPRGGNFIYSSEEFELMKEQIRSAKKHHADGIVLGLLQDDHTIDYDRLKELVAFAQPMSVTFHRAFDLVQNYSESLQSLIDIGIHRILTSGRQKKALEGSHVISELVKLADSRIIILAAGAITPENVIEVVRRTGVSEVHAMSGVSVIDSDNDNVKRYVVDTQKVRHLREALDEIR